GVSLLESTEPPRQEQSTVPVVASRSAEGSGLFIGTRESLGGWRALHQGGSNLVRASVAGEAILRVAREQADRHSFIGAGLHVPPVPGRPRIVSAESPAISSASSTSDSAEASSLPVSLGEAVVSSQDTSPLTATPASELPAGVTDTRMVSRFAADGRGQTALGRMWSGRHLGAPPVTVDDVGPVSVAYSRGIAMTSAR